MSYADEHRKIIEKEKRRHLKLILDHEKECIKSYDARKECLSMASRANSTQYAMWVKGYIEKGGKITHHYNYDMPDYFYMAKNGMYIPALYGAQSISIIIPKSSLVTYGDVGHNELFFMDGYIVIGYVVPMYNDVAAMI